MQADQDSLFEKILELALKDKLVLWAGAGLSLEAGYPSGGELTELLLQKLSLEERKELPQELMKISDYYVKRKKNGRVELIDVLKEIFSKGHNKSESHEMIQKMAFFKTIITTNYDELFEEYIPGIGVIKTTKDLTRVKSNTRKLIKIHGDLKSPKRLILTEGDYASLYEKDSRDPFWSKVKVELTEKGILFIGYGFNDLNVQGLFEYLHKKLKKQKHPKYLVAPGLSNSHQAKLKAYDIQYLNFTGRDFLLRLYKEVWKKKGYKYFGVDEISTDTLFNSLEAEGLQISVSKDPQGGRVIQFNPEPGKIWNLSFSIKDKEVEKRIEEWRLGLGPEDLILPEELIVEANLKFDDFVVGDKATFPEFHFKRIGNVEKNVRIVFENSRVEILLTEVRSHKYNHHGLKIIAENDHAALEIVIPEILDKGYSFKFTFKPKDPCSSISAILNWHDAIYCFALGEPFKIFSLRFLNGFRFPNGAKSANLETLKRNSLIFQVIRKIEEKFNIRFIEVFETEIFNIEFQNTLQGMLDLFKSGKIKRDLSHGIRIRGISENPQEKLNSLIDQVNESGYLVLQNMPDKVSFLNQELDMGKSQIFVKFPYLEESSTEPGIYLLKSKNNECFVMYEAFGLSNLENGQKLN